MKAPNFAVGQRRDHVIRKGDFLQLTDAMTGEIQAIDHRQITGARDFAAEEDVAYKTSLPARTYVDYTIMTGTASLCVQECAQHVIEAINQIKAEHRAEDLGESIYRLLLEAQELLCRCEIEEGTHLFRDTKEWWRRSSEMIDHVRTSRGMISDTSAFRKNKGKEDGGDSET